MNSRRTFIKTVGSGVAVSAIAPGIMANSFSKEKQLRIGIIGAEKDRKSVV